MCINFSSWSTQPVRKRKRKPKCTVRDRPTSAPPPPPPPSQIFKAASHLWWLIGPFCFMSTEVRWLIRDGGGDERMKAHCGYRSKKTGETVDRRQSNGSVTAVSPHHCPVTSALRNCCFNCRAGYSHKDNVRCTAVEEQLEAKEVQLSQPSSISLLMISSGLTWRSSSTSLLYISWSFDLAWNLDSPGCQYIYWVIPLTLACLWQYICTFWKQMLNIVTCRSRLPTFCCCCFVFLGEDDGMFVLSPLKAV